MENEENNLGYFDEDKREYVIKNMFPVRPLKNYLFNDKVVSSLDQFCFGLTNGLTSKDFRPLTSEERLVYVKDKDSNCSYSANRNYNNLPFEEFSCHVGIGYNRVVSKYQGLESEFAVLIPKDDFVELSRIILKNSTDKVKHLSIYSLIKPHINVTWHTPYTKPSFNKSINGIFYSHTGFDLQEKYVYSCYRSDSDIKAFELSERFFKGTYNSYADPISLHQEKLGSRIISFEDHLLGVLQFEIDLLPHQIKKINLAYILSDSAESIKKLSNKYGSDIQFEKELAYLKIQQDKLEDSCRITTDDKYLDIMVNTYLKRQISLGKTWGRVYGKGFRDVMQDVASFVSFDVKMARERIINTLAYFKIDGNALRQFDPIYDYPYRDGPSWVPQTVLTYINESGDLSILDEKVGYYQSQVEDTVFEHIVRGLYFLTDNKGAHGLCLWGGGDWNDSMNNCGTKGRGESVFLTLATIKAIDEFYKIVIISSKFFDLSKLKKSREELIKSVKGYGEDKDHLIYGYNDFGEKVGSYDNPDYGSIYLNPQTWAVLADIYSKDEAGKLMDLIESRLRCDFGFTLVDHSFKNGTDRIGRVSYFFPGCFENGSVYIHANAFKIAADLKLNRPEQAYKTLKLIRYDNSLNKNNGMEPYAISNMFLGPESGELKGLAPQSWITGSAGWLYRDITEEMIGVKAEFKGLCINPCLPKCLSSVRMKRKFRGVYYDIYIYHDNRHLFMVDKKVRQGCVIPILSDDKVHCVEFHY